MTRESYRIFPRSESFPHKISWAPGTRERATLLLISDYFNNYAQLQLATTGVGRYWREKFRETRERWL